MKNVNAILAMILLIMTGCGGKQSTDDLIIVDVTKSYPEKELILQDFMDVEYIALETTDDFVTQGSVRSIGKDIVIVTNQFNDGDIFVFDRTGKGLRKINRKGQGGEEYTSISGIILDENHNEMFVNNSSGKKILVYDLYGKFKRSFKYKDDIIRYDYIYQYDKDHLITLDGTLYIEGISVSERSAQSFFIISKQDGSIFKEIEIPFKQEKSLFVIDLNTGSFNLPRYYPNDYPQ